MKECSVPGCGRLVRTKGLCSAHYVRAWKGLPIDKPFERKRTPEETLAAFSIRDEDTNCLLWTRSKDTHGYGHFSIEGTLRLAHRVAYEIAKGPIEDGMVIDHLCRVRHCVNPDHMEVVTTQENTGRSHRNGEPIRTRTQCKWGHEFTEENTRWNKGYRECRECQRRSEQAYERVGRFKVA